MTATTLSGQRRSSSGASACSSAGPEAAKPTSWSGSRLGLLDRRPAPGAAVTAARSIASAHRLRQEPLVELVEDLPG